MARTMISKIGTLLPVLHHLNGLLLRFTMVIQVTASNFGNPVVYSFFIQLSSITLEYSSLVPLKFANYLRMCMG